VRERGQPERLVDAVADLVHGRHRAGVLGDRGEKGRVVELLQGAAAPPERRGSPAEHHQRRAVEPRGGHGRDAVGDARSGGEDGQAGAAGQLGRRLRREHGGRLVPDVDDRHRRLSLDRAVVQREHVRPGQREHPLDAVRAGDADGDLAAMGVGRRRLRGHG
jgi:hypothetical protein